MLKSIKDKRYRRYFVGLVCIWLAYVVLTLMAPPAAATNRYGLSVFEVNLLRVTILVPYLLIWFAGLYAVLTFKNYTEKIQGSAESESYRWTTTGLMFLVSVVVVPPFIGLFANYYPYSFDVQKWTAIIRNYATVLLYLTSFYYFWNASVSFSVTLVKDRQQVQKANLAAVVIVAVLSAIYVWSVLQNDFRTTSNDPAVKPTYYLHDPLILFTIIVPYILVWIMGALSISNQLYVTKEVSGVIYKQVFRKVNRGLTLLIVLVVVLQFLSQSSYFLGHASLSVILIIIYLLLFVIALGYFYLARAAKTLSAIEEI